MLLESVLLYKAIYAGVLKLAEPYRKQVIKEENEEHGVFRCVTMLEGVSAVEIGGSQADCVSPQFDTDEDPIGIVVGLEEVMLTIPEVKYLSSVEESGQWDTHKTAGVLKHIKESQLVRQILAQA